MFNFVSISDDARRLKDSEERRMQREAGHISTFKDYVCASVTVARTHSEEFAKNGHVPCDANRMAQLWGIPYVRKLRKSNNAVEYHALLR